MKHLVAPLLATLLLGLSPAVRADDIGMGYTQQPDENGNLQVIESLPFDEVPSFAPVDPMCSQDPDLLCSSTLPTSLQACPVISRSKKCKYYPNNAEILCNTDWTGLCPANRTPNNFVCRDVHCIITRCPYCGEDEADPGPPTPETFSPDVSMINAEAQRARNFHDSHNTDEERAAAQLAIDETVRLFGFKGNVVYDPNLPVDIAAGTIDPAKDIVYIGPSIFLEDPPTAAHLASAIGHEQTHLWFRQNHIDPDSFRDLDEAYAFGWELKFGKQLGLEQKYIDNAQEWYSYHIKQAQNCPDWSVLKLPPPLP